MEYTQKDQEESLSFVDSAGGQEAMAENTAKGPIGSINSNNT